MAPTEKMIEAVKALEASDGNRRAAARALGLNQQSFRERLIRAAKCGLTVRDPVMPGFKIKQVSRQTDAAGNLQKEWIKQSEIGDEFQIPENHIVKGVSALVDPNGQVVQQWIKTRQDTKIADVITALKESFAAYEGHATLPKAPAKTDKDTATVYVVGDQHLGLYAWAEETGEDYDLAIGAKLLMDTMTRLVARAPASETGVVLNLGDFFHSDSNENRTRRSGVALDVDTRYAKVLRTGVDLLIHCVQLALQKHKKVVVRNLPGNHDPYAALALSVAMASFFKNSKRVEVDTNASAFWKWRFGKVLLVATHGDMVKPIDMPGMTAARWPQDWGETEYRYAYFGHVHHRSVGGGEKAGMIWETFQVLPPKDAWHAASGYCSGRSMVAITHHRLKGEDMRQTLSIKGH